VEMLIYGEYFDYLHSQYLPIAGGYSFAARPASATGFVRLDS